MRYDNEPHDSAYQPILPLHHTIRDLPLSEQPRFRLETFGSSALSDGELLSLLLGGDSAENRATATQLLIHFKSLHELARASKARLMRVSGMCESDAIRLLAMKTLSQRLQQPLADERVTLKNPTDVAQILLPQMKYLDQEELRVVLLNIRQQVIGIETIYRGSLHCSVLRIGEIFRPAIEAPAASIILAHNHPSGEVSASQEDLRATQEICKAGKLLNIKVLDHIIIGSGRFSSLRESLSCFD